MRPGVQTATDERHVPDPAGPRATGTAGTETRSEMFADYKSALRHVRACGNKAVISMDCPSDSSSAVSCFYTNGGE